MTILKPDVDAQEEEFDEKKKQSLIVVEEQEPEYKKTHQNFLYKILKYNPIDSLNYLYRKFIEKHDLLKYEGKLQWWSNYPIIKEVMRILWNYRIENVSGDLFPEYGAGIIVSNHQSHLDPFFTSGAVHRRIRYMSKKENFKTPIVRTLFRNLGAFELDRDNPEEGWKSATKIIDEGEWIGIFPEGTRTEDGSLGEFRTGAVRLAIEKHMPIVPMAVLGSRDALPKGKLVMKPTHVTVRIGRAIHYDDYNIDDITYPEIKKLTEELRQIITEILEGNYERYGIEKKEELSIGSPKDMEIKPKSNFFMKTLKRIGKDLLLLWDDSWYSMLKSAEALGLKDLVGGFIYHFSGNIVHEFCKLMSPYKVIDYDKYVPKEGPAIICSNHNSEWDVIILATTFQQRGEYVHQQAKESLFKVPIVNSWVRSCRAFPLKRGGHDVGSYNYAIETLKKGERIIIYPEGTTNQGGGELLPGHTGSIRIAIEAKVPIIPIGITGTENVFPKHAKMLNFGKGAILKAGPLFREHEKYFDKPMPDYDELQRLTTNLMARIKDLMMYNTPDA